MEGSMTHGGKRTAGPGKKLGRPPKADAKIAYGTKLAPVVVEYLRQRANGAETIEVAIKRSKDFREWRRSRG